MRKKRSNRKIHHYSRNWKHQEFFDRVKNLYDDHDDWIFFCRKNVSSLSVSILKHLLVKVDELIWELNGDYPRIILEVIQDLVKGRIFFRDSRNKDIKKPFLHSHFLKVYFHNKGIELVQLNKILKKVNSFLIGSPIQTSNRYL